MGEEVGGKTCAQAEELLQRKVDQIEGQKITLNGSKSYVYEQNDFELNYQVRETVQRAYDLGRQKDYNPFKYYRQNLEIVTVVNEDRLIDELIKIAASDNEKVRNASASFHEGQMILKEENSGERILLAENKTNVMSNLKQLRLTSKLIVRTIEPDIKIADIEGVKSKIEAVISRGLILIDGERDFPISQQELSNFIAIKETSFKDTGKLARVFKFGMESREVVVVTNTEYIKKWTEVFAKNIDTLPVNLVLDYTDNKMIVKQASIAGKRVNSTELLKEIEAALQQEIGIIPVPIEAAKASINEDNLGKLGIQTLIAKGYSDFKGSSSSRVHNIQVGASKFNGILIKPDEEFSFNKVLGPVESYTGYLPELVILQNKTVPQYGGGLCQVSSTAFRAALNAGFPILARTNHAYPVQYYSPYGVDATIYLPQPDLVFKNDTGGSVLIQTYVVGTRLFFDLYGTKREGTIKFAGNKEGTYGVSEIVENIKPAIYDWGIRGTGSFTATFWRFIYNKEGELINTASWTSKYDSPLKYPH